MTLRAFYTGVDRRIAKIETREHGFAFLRALSNGAHVDYAELKKGVYKYRLSGIEPGFFDELLRQHAAGDLNLCAYFGAEQNSVFALNVDSISSFAGKGKILALCLLEAFDALGVAPLTLRSGHGYHLLCRLARPAPNGALRALMDGAVRRAADAMERRGVTIADLQCTGHPRPRHGDVSLRLFGSAHVRTGLFPCVAARIGREDDLLGEAESWACFEDYLQNGALAKEQFEAACRRLREQDGETV